MSNQYDSVDVKLDVKVAATIECKSLSCPGYFLRKISEGGPHVVMPDGTLYRPSYGCACGEFPNAVAKRFAEANGGIYFESPSDMRSFKFADFVEAIRRLLPNVDEHRKITELAKDPKCLEAIAAEGKFLEDVSPWIGVDMFGNHPQAEGLKGEIVDRERENTTYFGPENGPIRGKSSGLSAFFLFFNGLSCPSPSYVPFLKLFY